MGLQKQMDLRHITSKYFIKFAFKSLHVTGQWWTRVNSFLDSLFGLKETAKLLFLLFLPKVNEINYIYLFQDIPINLTPSILKLIDYIKLVREREILESLLRLSPPT